MLKPVGSHTQNSSLSSVVTISRETTGTHLLIQALSNNVRLTLDGTDPTASKGFQIAAGDDPVMIEVPNGATVKVIEEDTASIEYQWFTNYGF